MFIDLKTHFRSLEMGFLALLSTSVLCSCSLLQKDNDLYGPFSVPAEYTFVIVPPQREAERNQSWLLTGYQTLDSAVTPQERSQILNGLGLVYEELGLNAMARYMFMNSIVLNTCNPDAFAHLGYHFTTSDRIDDAVESYSSAKELAASDNKRLSCLDELMTMYYTGHKQIALETVRTFYEEAPSDPYHMLWDYLITADVKGKDEAIRLLTSHYESVKDDEEIMKDWGFNLVKLYLGKMSQKELFDNIRQSVTDEEKLQEHLCEAYFYIGKLHLYKGEDKKAYDYFTLCLSTAKYLFIEYRAAVLEVRNLKRKYHLLKQSTKEADED